MFRIHLWPALAGFLVASAAVFCAPVLAVESGVWTLESAVRQALEAAPEARAADAEVEAHRAEYRQADAWPNPTLELSASDKLGLEDGSGGRDVTRAAITQPLPFMRLERERRVARANIEAAERRRRAVRLDIEQRAALAFHALQQTYARLRLARERVATAQSYSIRKRDRLVRYLAPAERLRLEILQAEAAQALASAEGEWSEAASQFHTLLALPPETAADVSEVAPAPAPAALDVLLAKLETHAALAAARAEQEAANAGIDAARSRRFTDPALTVFRERDVIGGSRRDVNGVGLAVQIPLWNRNDGGVGAAGARADTAEAKRVAVARELEARTRKSHAHLGHLLEQTEHFRRNVLAPARKLLDVAGRSFAAGETNVLALVDAYDSHFQAQARYVELLAEGWREAAELRAATDQSVLEATP